MGKSGAARRRGVVRAAAMAVLLVAVATGCGGDGGGDRGDGGREAATTERTPTTPTTRPAQPDVPTDATQPAQPASGPGGSDYAHGDWRVSSGGSGSDAWYVFEPVDPQPREAPVTIMLHGYFEYAGYDQLHDLIRHTVRTGSIVVYPRWQTDVAAPCPGPADIEPCVASATAGILGALDHLAGDPARVQPDLERAGYFGFSFGGILTANLTNRHEDLGLPVPRAILLDDPHDGGVAGPGEPALDDSLDGIPSSTLVVCHSGAEGVVAEPGKAGSTCNAVFPRLDHIDADDKALVMTHPDGHGAPPLSSGHGVCASWPGTADAYDWGFCWRTWDALRSAAEDGTDRAYALGDTPEQRSIGAWSDGVAVVPLTVEDEALRP
jgi:dienelactone hydrolase